MGDLRIRPSRAEFLDLVASREIDIVPVWTEAVADTVTPVGAFGGIVGPGEAGFLLESVEGGERWGRYSFIGRRPLATITARGRVVMADGTMEVPTGDDLGALAALEELVESVRVPDTATLPPLHSGVVGYLGYDVVREVEDLPNVPKDDLGHPDAGLYVIGELAAFDHWAQKVVLIDNVIVVPGWSPEEAGDAWDAAAAAVEALAADCLTSRPSGAGPTAPPTRVPKAAAALGADRTMTPGEYGAAIAAAKEEIVAGEIFQVVLAQRWDLDLGADPFEVYRALRLLNPSPYLYFLALPDVTIVGSSPEPMVRLRDGVVTSRPIAGSRPRGETPAADALFEAELIEDPKELAEHVMLIDLARNDVGRVVEFGTEQVDEMMTVERYSHIMHLTSQVSGRLRADKGPIDVLRATLPAGTLSGAPKVRAMEIIDDLEVTKRGIYGGVVGYLDFSGNLDTAIAIRTLVVGPDGRASIQAGAGIVADSDPAREDEECGHKAAALLAAILAARSR